MSRRFVQNDEILTEKIRKVLANYPMSAISRSVPVVILQFGENAALMGSFPLILERILLLESTGQITD